MENLIQFSYTLTQLNVGLYLFIFQHAGVNAIQHCYCMLVLSLNTQNGLSLVWQSVCKTIVRALTHHLCLLRKQNISLFVIIKLLKIVFQGHFLLNCNNIVQGRLQMKKPEIVLVFYQTGGDTPKPNYFRFFLGDFFFL